MGVDYVPHMDVAVVRNFCSGFNHVGYGVFSMNNSGINPTEYNVLIEPKTTEEVTAGGVILSQSIQNLDQNAQTKGVIVAMSPMAFINPDWPEDAQLPQVGDAVSYARYAGASSKIEGMDGVEYIIVKDKEITAVIDGGMV